MLIIKEEQKKLLAQYGVKYDDSSHVNDILEQLSDLMLESLDENDERTEATLPIVLLYDAIYSQNE